MAQARLAARALRRSPIVSLIAVLTMALGITLVGILLSFVNAVALRPFAVHEPATLARVYVGDADAGTSNRRFGRTSAPDYLDYRSRSATLFSGLAFNVPGRRFLVANAPVNGTLVSGNYFDVIGVTARLGRALTRDDEGGRGAHPVAVISDRLWQNQFGADPRVLGKTVQIGRGSFTIVGVLPKAFTGTDQGQRSDLWVPFTMQETALNSEYLMEYRDARLGQMIGRLRPDVTLAQAQASVAAIGSALALEHPDFDGTLAPTVASFDTSSNHDRPGLSIAAIGALVALLIHLIACTNLVSLLTARAMSRRRDTAVRMVLGASRRQLVAQAMLEALLLAMIGLAAGVWLTFVATRMLESLPINAGLVLTPDPWIVAALAGFAAVTGLIVGGSAALQTAGDSFTGAIAGGGFATSSHKGLPSRLVVGQLVMTMVLLIATALGVRSAEALRQVDPGFDMEQLLFVHIDQQDEGPDWPTVTRTLLDNVRQIHGVTRVSLSQLVPLERGFMDWPTTVPGYVYGPGESHQLNFDNIGPDYFRTMGIPLLEGKEFDQVHPMVKGALSTIVVNEAMARRFWPGRSAIGQQVLLQNRVPSTVIGVVANARLMRLDSEAQPTYFINVLGYGYEMVVRTSAPPQAMIDPIRETIERFGSAMERPRFQTIESSRDFSLRASNYLIKGLGGFALLALGMSLIGLYGLLTFLVHQREREIGIRMALGAERQAILRLILGRAGSLLLAGLLLGLGCGWIAAQLASSWLFGVSSDDPIALGLAATVLLGTGLAAAWLPARRASRVDPMVAIRAE
jgi:predicted permease